MEKLNLKGGALIIGSLLWQDDLKNENKDGIRKEWRNSNLKEERLKIQLPIRYGRLSRGGIFTMVLSKNCETGNMLGTGYVIAFKNQNLNNWDEIKNQAVKMSTAEGMNGKFIGGSKKIWCTMSVLFNPMLDEEIKEYILQNWQKKVLLDGGGKDLTEYKFGEEKSAIKENCSLNFNWFKTTNEEEKSKLDELDFIICTVTKQENSKSNDYPSVFEILNSVKKDLDRKYFMNNIANGIATFQDSQVLKEMKNSVNRM